MCGSACTCCSLCRQRCTHIRTAGTTFASHDHGDITRLERFVFGTNQFGVARGRIQQLHYSAKEAMLAWLQGFDGDTEDLCSVCQSLHLAVLDRADSLNLIVCIGQALYSIRSTMVHAVSARRHRQRAYSAFVCDYLHGLWQHNIKLRRRADMYVGTDLLGGK